MSMLGLKTGHATSAAIADSETLGLLEADGLYRSKSGSKRPARQHGTYLLRLRRRRLHMGTWPGRIEIMSQVARAKQL